MAGNNSGRKFTIARPDVRTQPREDFAAVFAGAFTDQPAVPLDLPVDAIEPSPYQARQDFADLEELAEAIRVHGFTSRIRVRPHPTQPERYQLVYGERRLRAAKLAGLQMIPCDVAQHSEADLREIGLIENLQRQDLAALEEARAFRVMLDDNGYSIRTLAARIGKSKGYIQNKLDLLRAPADVQDMINRRADAQTVGLMIAQLPTEEQRRPLIEGVLAGALDSSMVRDMVNRLQTGRAAPSDDQPAASAAWRDAQPGQPGAPAETRDVAHAGRRERGSLERRHARHSERALAQAIQTLRVMTAQLRETAAQLQPADRSALLDHIVRDHFPELEQLVEDLRG